MKSAEFYTEIFNQKPIEESGTFAMFALSNGTMLGLWSKYTAEPRVEASAGAMDICFSTDNVDATYELLSKRKEKFTVMVNRENAKPNSKEYKFKTIKEMYSFLNPENVDKFLEDFCVGVKSMVLMLDVAKTISPENNESELIELEELTWIDD